MLCENNWKHVVQKVENWQTSHLHVFVHRIQFCFFFRTVLFNCILRFEEPTPPSTAIYPYEGNTEEVDFSKQNENNKQKQNQNRFTKIKGWLEESPKTTQNPDFLVFSFLFGFLVCFFSVCFVFFGKTLHSLCCWTHKSTGDWRIHPGIHPALPLGMFHIHTLVYNPHEYPWTTYI